MCAPEKDYQEGREALLSSRKIGSGSPQGREKGTEGPPIEYVFVFMCPDGTTLQHPVAPTRRRRRRWLKLTRKVMAFVFKVVF